MNVVHVEVVKKDNESDEHLIKRFLKKCKKVKIMDEINNHNFYKSPSELKREKQKRKDLIIRKKQEEFDQKNDG